jgi:hypothetical protein
MEFDDFFNHIFIRKTVSTVPTSSATTAAAAVPTRRSPPLPVPTPVTKTAPVQVQQQQNNNAPTPEEADDFVLVPSPSQQRTLTAGFNGNEAVTEVGGGVQSSQPIPVPSQRSAFLKVCWVSHIKLFRVKIQWHNSLSLFHAQVETTFYISFALDVCKAVRSRFPFSQSGHVSLKAASHKLTLNPKPF